MSKRVLMVMVAALMIFGFTMDSGSQGRGSAPVVEGIFATPEFNHGDVVKIYIHATDADGDIRWVRVTAGNYTAVTRVKKDMGGNLNGYIFWSSSQAARREGKITLQIAVDDWAGNESNAVSVPLVMKAGGAKMQPPPAEFKDVEIGPVMIQPTPFSGGA